MDFFFSLIIGLPLCEDVWTNLDSGHSSIAFDSFENVKSPLRFRFIQYYVNAVQIVLIALMYKNLNLICSY